MNNPYDSKSVVHFIYIYIYLLGLLILDFFFFFLLVTIAAHFPITAY